MKQYEQVIEVMEKNGGFATLGFLNQNVDVSDWKTKTPFATIRRIVQDDRFFFKIRPGLWALDKYRGQIEEKLHIGKVSGKEEEVFDHTYYQGLLVEIGNIKGLETFVPNQDKNKSFLGKPLKEVATLNNIHDFSYQNVVQKAKTVDVVWFNHRGFPSSFFEVEYTTDFQNSLLKFTALQDFYAKFYIVSHLGRKRNYQLKIALDVFRPLKERVEFIDYDCISNIHAKSHELYKLQIETGL